MKRLNWEILPQGKIPWDILSNNLNPIVKRAREGNREMIWYRIHKINEYRPDFYAVGKAGFRGYIVFGFEDKNLYIFESIYHGNATYIFDNSWEELSKLSKAEILNKSLQKERIIHRINWINEIHKFLK